ncbi:hypothetical protein [Paenarthrobacter aurescens]|uniref:hypothetical protein n=1 Tax=Paenarthrobacter aurescens TaxID=43663 RepID=UPI0035E6781D
MAKVVEGAGAEPVPFNGLHPRVLRRKEAVKRKSTLDVLKRRAITGNDMLDFTNVNIIVHDARARDEQLTDAVSQLLPAALKLRKGILVTRQDSARYTCEVDSSVPWGIIQERSEI